MLIEDQQNMWIQDHVLLGKNTVTYSMRHSYSVDPRAQLTENKTFA